MWAHCHIFPPTRGTICLRPSKWHGMRLSNVQWMIRHEVAHMVAISHRSPAFQRAAHSTGHGPHHHRWRETNFTVYRFWLPPTVVQDFKCRCGATAMTYLRIVGMREATA